MGVEYRIVQVMKTIQDRGKVIAMTGKTLAARGTELVLALAPALAQASGFRFNQRSTRALGAALSAPVPTSEAVGTGGFNPAALPRLRKAQVAGDASVVVPQSDGTFTNRPARGVSFDSSQGVFVPAFAAGVRVNDVLAPGSRHRRPSVW